MKLHRLPLFAVAASLALGHSNGQTTVATDPVGFTSIIVTNAATPTGRRATVMSIPLLDTDPSLVGLASGTISSVASNRISVANAGWAPGALSRPNAPFVIQITSGSAAGRMFLVASSASTAGALGSAALANTATNLFISGTDQTQVANNLPGVGLAAGDSFRLFACDTLGSAFGTPATSGIRGGSNAATADNIIVAINNTATTYFYNTNNNAWFRSGTSFGASNVALAPYFGVTYNRLGGTTNLTFVSTGQVPVTNRIVPIRNSGITTLAQYWPVAGTLRGLGIQNLPGWVPGTNTTGNTDNVIVTAAGTATTYFWNGTNWRRSGFPTSQDNVVIPIGSAVQILKKGNASGFTPLSQAVPYNLNQ